MSNFDVNKFEFEMINTRFKGKVDELKVILGKLNRNVDSITNSNNWSGDSSATFKAKYKEISDNYETIESTLDGIVSLLNQSLKDYISAEIKTSASADNNSTELSA